MVNHYVQLQQHFNEVIFNLEREMYLEEGIPLSEVHYIDLIAASI